MLIFCSDGQISFIYQELLKHDITPKDFIVWRKSNPMPRNIERRYVRDMELALVGVKNGGKGTFNKDPNKPYMRSLIETSTVSGNEKVGHPTQKSLILMKQLIQTHTNPNDTIIDPFMGSGTTGVACKELGRNFIGIEKDENYFKMAEKRLG